MQIFQMAKSLSSMAHGSTRNGSSTQSNGFSHLTNGNSFSNKQQSDQTSPSLDQADNIAHHSSNNNSSNNNNGSNGTSQSSQNHQTSAATSIVNNHFAGIMDPEQELKQIEEFKLKGEVVIHGEISFFVYKHDLKQSQIARMAGVNQAYVSKFLRGEFFDLSENGKSLIYKWYLRFLKNPQIYQQAHNLSINPNLTGATGLTALAEQKTTTTTAASLTSHASNLKTELSSFSGSFNNVTNTSYDAPRRSRFSFKSEHLLVS